MRPFADQPHPFVSLGILSDANNTRTRAFADYDDIRAAKQSRSPERIQQILTSQ